MPKTKGSPEYRSEYKSGNRTWESPSNVPRNNDSGKDKHSYHTGKNTYTGPEKPSEGRPGMSKKWVEK